MSLEDKVTLFRSLFKGREDVFARRWYNNTTGKGGYQPVCANEWRVGICDKKAHKCTDCPNRDFAPLSDMDIYRHLEGKDERCRDVIGLYVIMSDNRCAFLCADFDDKSCQHGYQNDAHAFIGTCKDWGIPYSIERSRSGNGAHVWVFFETPIPAYKARRLGNAILTEAMNQDGRLSFNSYDRLFPNQDMLPEGGFGNLIALPLQGKARRMNNCVFVDDDFLPYQDQWAYLYQIKKVGEPIADVLLSLHKTDDLSNLTTSSDSKPWITPIPQQITVKDFISPIEITKADKIYIPLKAVSNKVVNHLKRIASFKNPEFYCKQALRFSTYSTPRIITCVDIIDDFMAMPRGCEDPILNLFDNYSVIYRVTDKTCHGIPINVRFNGKERKEQLDAIAALLQHTCGVLSATTAFGKTVTAASLIAHRKVNTLILVHSKALLEQWHEKLSSFLDIEYVVPEELKRHGQVKRFSPIGLLDSTADSLHGIIDIALIQSCIKTDEVKTFVHNYGMVIVDECHHVPSITFEKVLKSVKSKYVYGLTATPIRKDGHQPIIFMQCGPIRFTADAKSQIENQSFRRYLIPRFTSFRSICDYRQSFASLTLELSQDELRNKMIVEDVCAALSFGRTPIVLTGRTSHVECLHKLLSQQTKNVLALTGSGTVKEKREALQHLYTIPDDEPLVIVATGRYIGEGFDYPRLDTLFLTLPFSQYAGRLHREYEGKKDVLIYDYIDIHEPFCENMFHKRVRGYASIGYKMIEKSAPTLFDDFQGLELAKIEGQIFNGKTFNYPFHKTVSEAKHSIVISSPHLSIGNRSLVTLLKELSGNGIEIRIFTSVNDNHVNDLIMQGLSVTIVPSLNLCCSIIDKSTVWYGCVNILGYASEEDSIIKVVDSMLANELLGIIKDSLIKR